MAGRVDPAYWTRQRKFGVAGGPDEIVLTDEGELRAFCVGTQLKEKSAKALLALASIGGDGELETWISGTKLRPTDLLRKWDMIVWGDLKAKGYVEYTPHERGIRGEGVRLTVAGRRAVDDGREEQKRLLDRVKRSEGVQEGRMGLRALRDRIEEAKRAAADEAVELVEAADTIIRCVFFTIKISKNNFVASQTDAFGGASSIHAPGHKKKLAVEKFREFVTQNEKQIYAMMFRPFTDLLEKNGVRFEVGSRENVE